MRLRHVLSPQLPELTQQQRIVRIWVPGMLATLVWVGLLVLMGISHDWLVRSLGALPLAYTYYVLDLHEKQHGPYRRSRDRTR